MGTVEFTAAHRCSLGRVVRLVPVSGKQTSKAINDWSGRRPGKSLLEFARRNLEANWLLLGNVSVRLIWMDPDCKYKKELAQTAAEDMFALVPFVAFEIFDVVVGTNAVVFLTLYSDEVVATPLDAVDNGGIANVVTVTTTVFIALAFKFRSFSRSAIPIEPFCCILVRVIGSG